MTHKMKENSWDNITILEGTLARKFSKYTVNKWIIHKKGSTGYETIAVPHYVQPTKLEKPVFLKETHKVKKKHLKVAVLEVKMDNELEVKITSDYREKEGDSIQVLVRDIEKYETFCETYGCLCKSYPEKWLDHEIPVDRIVEGSEEPIQITKMALVKRIGLYQMRVRSVLSKPPKEYIINADWNLDFSDSPNHYNGNIDYGEGNVTLQSITEESGNTRDSTDNGNVRRRLSNMSPQQSLMRRLLRGNQN